MDAGNSDKVQFYKVKKFACKSLKGRGARSGIRLIYAYLPVKKHVVLLELYYKGDKENHDPTRIKSFLKDTMD